MDRKWWFIGAGIAGILLAFLLFPKQDIGDFPDPKKGRVDFDQPADAENTETPIARMPDRGGSSARLRPEALRRNVAKAGPENLLVRQDGVRTGGNPVSRAVVESRSTPEGIYAGRAQSPFALIRRQLLLAGEDDAKAMANQLGHLISDLRDMRRNPNPDEWEALETQMNSWSDRIANSDYVDDEHVTQSLERLDGILEEYHVAKEDQQNADVEADGESP